MLQRRRLPWRAARQLVQVDTVVLAPAFLLEGEVELLRQDYMAVLAAERRMTVKSVGEERSEMAVVEARQVEKRVRRLHWAEREMLFLCLM